MLRTVGRCDVLLVLLLTNKIWLRIGQSMAALTVVIVKWVEIKMLTRVRKASSSVDPGADGSRL